MSIAHIYLGTIGKGVGALVQEQLADQPMVVFDSDRSMVVPVPLAVDQIELSIDGQDVVSAMSSGSFSGYPYISPSMLLPHSLATAMRLSPSVGNLAADVHLSTIRNAVVKLVEQISGDPTILRVHSSFGGTSRGAAQRTDNILWDIAKSTGMRIRIMDIVTIPGLATVSSSFHPIYMRNTYAYVKEISALRTGRFLRHVCDDNGNPFEERTGFLPHTLVLVNDTQRRLGTVPLTQLLATVAEFVGLLSRPEVSLHFQGVASDLEQHDTAGPHADSLGLSSLFIPNREEERRRELEMSIEILSPTTRTDHTALAKRLLESMGFHAPEAERLQLWALIRSNLVELLGDPVEEFRAFYTSNADEYFHEYNPLMEAIESVDTASISEKLLRDLLTQGIDEQLKALRKLCPPEEIGKVLNTAITILESEHRDLETSVCGDEAEIYTRIEEYEDNASHAAKRLHEKRRKPRTLVEEVRSNLHTALELRVKAALLRVLTEVIGGFLEALAQDEVKAWTDTEAQAKEVAQAMTELREELSSQLLHAADLRGNAEPVERRKKTDPVENDVLIHRVNRGLYAVIQRMYGRPCESVKAALRSYLGRRLKAAHHSKEQLTSRHVTQDMFTKAVQCAEPFMLVDMTSRTYRRAVFCLSHVDCQDLLKVSLSETGIRCDRDKHAAVHGVNDELTVMMYDKGVPLSSIKSLRECRSQYLADPERYYGHLEPLYELLPDPLGLDSRMILLMARLAGNIQETQDGLAYCDLTGHPQVLNSLFIEYGMAVEIASRLIMHLKKGGFAQAIGQLDRMDSSGEHADVGAELRIKLEQFAGLYGQ